MESELALKSTVDLFKETNNNELVSQLVTDDDSLMRAYLSHENKKGKLPLNVPASRFLADPGHMVKVMVKGIIA